MATGPAAGDHGVIYVSVVRQWEKSTPIARLTSSDAWSAHQLV